MAIVFFTLKLLSGIWHYVQCVLLVQAYVLCGEHPATGYLGIQMDF
jgi:hypothetical protein